MSGNLERTLSRYASFSKEPGVAGTQRGKLFVRTMLAIALLGLVVGLLGCGDLGQRDLTAGDRVSLSNGTTLVVPDGWTGEWVNFDPEHVPPLFPQEKVVLHRLKEDPYAEGDSFGVHIWPEREGQFLEDLELETREDAWRVIARQDRTDGQLVITASLFAGQGGQDTLTLRGFYDSEKTRPMDVLFVLQRTFDSEPTSDFLVEEYQDLLRQFSIDIPAEFSE